MSNESPSTNNSTTEPSVARSELTTSQTIPPKWGKLDDPRKPEDVIGTVRKYKTFLKRQIGEVELTEFNEINCKGAVILECFPFVGLVAPLCGKNIVKALKLPLIGVIESEHFPVFGVVQNEQPSLPARIYGNQNLVVFMSEMNLKIPPETVRSLVDCIIDFAHRHRSPMIYSIEGKPRPDTVDIDGKQVTFDIRSGSQGDGDEEEGEEDDGTSEVIIDDTLLTRLTLREQDAQAKLLNPSSTIPLSDSRSGTPKKNRKNNKKQHNEEEDKTIEDMAEEMFGKKVHYITTNIESAKKMRASGLIPVVEGIIPGTSGGLISKASFLDNDQDVTVLLAPTSLLLPDPNAVLPILKVLSEMVPGVELESVYAEIEKEGTDLHKMISSLLEKTVADKKGKVPFGMYG
jgi:predicted ATP-grasp superfamily ATP-dependent carboligase